MDSSQNTPSAAPQATTPAGPGYGDVLGLKKDGVYFPMNHPNPTPIPYTPEQLAQIQAYGGFTPEELRRMGAAELVAPPVQVAAPVQSGGGYVAPASPAVANNAQVAIVPNEVRGLEAPVSATGRPMLTPEAAGPLRQIMMAAANGIIPEDEAALADAYRVANNMPRAAATPASAADYGSRYITPGHDDSLTLNAIFGSHRKYDPDLDDKD